MPAPMAKLLYETRDRIAYLTLNRPSRRGHSSLGTGRSQPPETPARARTFSTIAFETSAGTPTDESAFARASSTSVVARALGTFCSFATT